MNILTIYIMLLFITLLKALEDPMSNSSNYPVTLDIDYPDRVLNRWSTFFRVFWLIPISIIWFFLYGINSGGESERGIVIAATGFIVIPTFLMILFRQKYPKWWFDWNVALVKFMTRLGASFCLLNDVYPSTDEDQNVHITILYPDAKTELNRWLPLVKWFLAIPHYIVLAFLSIGVVVVVIIAWFSILFTGRFPQGLFNYIVNVFRYVLHIQAYAFLLITDQYPPFSLS